MEGAVEKYDFFELIPNEIILYIFEMLPQSTLKQCAVVSKRWRDVAYDGSLWRVVEFGIATVPLGVLENILMRGTFELKISTFTKISFYDPALLEGKTPFRLKRLEINCKDAENAGICALLNRCPELTQLILHLPSCERNVCTAISLIKDLQYLYLGASREISVKDVAIVVRGCLNLKEWCVDSLYGFMAVKKLFAELPSTIKKFCVPCGFITEIYDSDVESLVTLCPDIAELSLGYSEFLTEKSIEFLLELKSLRSLNISGCGNIPFDSIRLFHQLKSLQTLKVPYSVSKAQANILARYLPGVKVIF